MTERMEKGTYQGPADPKPTQQQQEIDPRPRGRQQPIEPLTGKRLRLAMLEIDGFIDARREDFSLGEIATLDVEWETVSGILGRVLATIEGEQS